MSKKNWKPLKNKIGYVEQVFSKNVAEDYVKKHKDKGVVMMPVVPARDLDSAIKWFKAKIFFIDDKEAILKLFDEAFEDVS